MLLLQGGDDIKIGLIDADLLDKGTRFPNLALMKLSSYYQNQGHKTKLIDYNQIPACDKVFLSKVFDFTDMPINLNFYKNIEYGGTGFDYDKNDFLPDQIEHSKPDYSLYEDFNDRSKYYSNHSIGFTTRFCFRQCQFCVNRDKEKAVRWSRLEEFDCKENNYITLLDDNILAHSDREKIIKKLQETGKPFEFKQGIDLRLINDRISKLLNESKYAGEFIFAFDDIKDKKEIEESFKIWRKYNKSKIKFYVLAAYDRNFKYDNKFWINDIINTFERIKFLMRHKALPYIMRYKEYENSPFRGMYVNIAGWCNQPHLLTKMSFREYSLKKNPEGASQRYMENFESEYPAIAKEYFDMKWKDLLEVA